VAWRVAMEIKQTPVCLVLTRQKVPIFDRSKLGAADGLRKGAYILSDCDGTPDILLMASGSEVQLILGAQSKLAEQGIKARVISFPSWDLFEKQPQDYKDSVLPPEVWARVSVEAASPLGWHKYIGDRGTAIGVTEFGSSAPGETVLANYGFTVDNVTDKALALLGRK
jgi:transketolase